MNTNNVSGKPKADVISGPICHKASWFRIFTLFAISVAITVLDSSNNRLRLLSQWNGALGLSKFLNGSIRSAMLILD